MPTEPPPSRYRVVERGRRLEVIDTLADASVVTRMTPPMLGDRRTSTATTPVARGAIKSPVERTGFDGRAVLTTRAWFDDKAPRRLSLDPGTAQHLDGARTIALGAAVIAVILLVFQPYLAILLIPLLDKRVRARLRAAATTWLDRLPPAT